MKSPVAMPDMYVGAQQFELQRVDYTAPEASGRVGGVQSGFPLWSAAWSLTRMPVSYSDEWRAWLSNLRGATRRFIGRPLDREYPREHPDGFGSFGSFTGTATSWSENINSDGDCELTLVFPSAANGVILSQGDYVDFRYPATESAVLGLPWRALVRIVAGGTVASGSVMVKVEPSIPSAVPPTAVAHIDQPGCTMALLLEQTQLDSVDVLKSIQGGTIAGIQDIRS